MKVGWLSAFRMLVRDGVRWLRFSVSACQVVTHDRFPEVVSNCQGQSFRVSEFQDVTVSEA